MKAIFRCNAVLISVVFASTLAPTQGRAGLIVASDGSGAPGPGSPGTMYSVDPGTGDVTLLGLMNLNGYFPTSSSPAPYSYFLRGVNLYGVDFSTNTSVEYGCFDNPTCYEPGGDAAYDSIGGGFYRIGNERTTQAAGLYSMHDTGTMAFERYELVTYQWIGAFDGPPIQVMEYIPGLGLYGIGDGGIGFLIDEATAHLTPLAPLSEPVPITGLAFDPDSGRLLATTGSYFNPVPTSQIYLLDPITGVETLLNGNAPNLTGIADVEIPESGTTWMMVLGLALCSVASLPRTRRNV